MPAHLQYVTGQELAWRKGHLCKALWQINCSHFKLLKLAEDPRKKMVQISFNYLCWFCSYDFHNCWSFLYFPCLCCIIFLSGTHPIQRKQLACQESQDSARCKSVLYTNTGQQAEWRTRGLKKTRIMGEFYWALRKYPCEITQIVSITSESYLNEPQWGES